MRHLLTLLTCLFILSPNVVLGETVKYEDLVKREGLYYKKFTNVPFTGKVTKGREQGRLKNGKRVGVWVEYDGSGRVSKEVTYENGKKVTWVQYKYHSNGQLRTKETYKDGKFDGPWVNFNEDGTVDEERTGTFKNGVKISD